MTTSLICGAPADKAAELKTATYVNSVYPAPKRSLHLEKTYQVIKFQCLPDYRLPPAPTAILTLENNAAFRIYTLSHARSANKGSGFTRFARKSNYW